MHWVDVIADRLLARGKSHVVASGTSISGQIHIGNAGDVIMADGVCRAVRERGADARLFWIADDVDPLRKIPKQLPPSFDEYLGKPVSTLPCPEGCCASFVEHFTRPFMESLAELGIRPEVKSGYGMYREGEYEPLARVALERGDEVRAILADIAGTKKAEGWLPFEAICSSCGKLATTHSYRYEGGKVFYRCTGGVAGKTAIPGCGHEGAADLRSGKLPWRVEWAARWKILGVTCEPFGKEHAASGGSYDTSKVLTERVFSYPPPEPVIYEHILVGGKKMSKSLGNVLTLGEFLSVAPPEVVRYFFFRTKASKHKDFAIERNLLPLIEEYERSERLHFGAEAPTPQEDLDEIRRGYDLSQVAAPPERLFQIPFSHLLTVVQIKPTMEGVTEVLRRSSSFPAQLDASESGRLARKAGAARHYLDEYAGEEEKFRLVTGGTVPLTPGQARFLPVLTGALASSRWSPESLHAAIYEAARSTGIEGREGFEAVYQVLLGKRRGPRLGFFLASLERDWVVGRLRNAG